MKEITFKLISINLFAKLIFNITKDGTHNHFDAYTDVDLISRTATESIAISKINYFDTPTILIGGYGGDVKLIAKSGYDNSTEKEFIDKISAALSYFTLENDFVAVDIKNLENTEIDYSKLDKDDLDILEHSKIMVMSIPE